MLLKGSIARQREVRMRNIVVLPRLRPTPGDLPITRRELKWAQRIVVCSLLVIVFAYTRKKGG